MGTPERKFLRTLLHLYLTRGIDPRDYHESLNRLTDINSGSNAHGSRLTSISELGGYLSLLSQNMVCFCFLVDQKRKIRRSKPAAGICSRCGGGASVADMKTATRFCYSKGNAGEVSETTHELIKTTHGRCVIEFCLRIFSHEDVKPLLSEITDNFSNIAEDRWGCCVVQRCVDVAEGEIKSHLFNHIAANALFLSEDPYGYFSLQQCCVDAS
ncbi:Pumilio RNA-binding repeat [Dillenia turbinata]|uniref:Pumilio RNA-binding repeat n=1 Tax=Dillenia turbinata TaxID=194707 RepID=A0AAN8WF14_9MAGN